MYVCVFGGGQNQTYRGCSNRLDLWVWLLDPTVLDGDQRRRPDLIIVSSIANTQQHAFYPWVSPTELVQTRPKLLAGSLTRGLNERQKIKLRVHWASFRRYFVSTRYLFLEAGKWERERERERERVKGLWLCHIPLSMQSFL
jgi:hypothetical protein